MIVQSLPDDRTARARIRDEALTLFADRGADAVTVRDVAGAAGVSAALVIRHYGSKAGLRDAVDDYVVRVFDAILADGIPAPAAPRASSGSRSGSPFEPAAMPGLADAVAAHLPADSPMPAYLARILIGGSAAGTHLFTRLHRASRQALDRLVEAGMADPGMDADVRAAVLLVNDLAMLMLRRRLTEVLDVDPLGPDGLARWAAEVLAIYRGGLATPPVSPDSNHRRTP